MQKKILQTTMVILFWEVLMFYQIFFSPQVKRSLIVSNKLVYTSCLTSCHTTYDLESQEISKFQNNVKTLWNYNVVPSFPSKRKILSILAKGSLKIEIELRP